MTKKRERSEFCLTNHKLDDCNNEVDLQSGVVQSLFCWTSEFPFFLLFHHKFPPKPVNMNESDLILYFYRKWIDLVFYHASYSKLIKILKVLFPVFDLAERPEPCSFLSECTSHTVLRAGSLARDISIHCNNPISADPTVYHADVASPECKI